MTQTLTVPAVSVRPCDGRVVVRFGSVVLAASQHGKVIGGRGSSEIVVVPLRDIFLNYFTVSERLERQPGIGIWRAGDLALGGRTVSSAMWTLVDAEADAESAFFHARFDLRYVTVETKE